MPKRAFSMVRRRLTYANVMATIAVFLALGGTSYAVTALPKNSVGTQQLKKNAVTGVKVKDGSLSSADFAAGTLLKGDTGATGATGAQGERGPQGAAAALEAEWTGNTDAVPLDQAITSNLVVGSFQVSTSGRVFVYATTAVRGTCTLGQPKAALYYHAQGVATWTPVTKSALPISGAAATATPITLMGLINTNLAVGNY
ncbi:MAG: hypothetical protein ACKOD0_09560, partial [Actinomycetota bacterium]